MEMRTQAVGGTAMRWHERGEGVPLVLIHGIPTGPLLWRHVAPRIAGARCLAWEMTGYAGSIAAGRDQDLSVAAQAERLVAWMEALGIERAVLAGHDLGGGVAQIAAVRRPERCAGLFLTNAIAYDSWPIPSVRAMRAARGAVARLPAAALRPVMGSLFRRGHDDAGRAREAMETHFPFYRDHGGGAALARQVAALDARDTEALAPALPRLGVPARLVWGAADGFQRIRYGERLARDLSAPLRRIEGGRHFTPEDHPEIVAEEIGALVAAVAAGDRPLG